MIASTDLMWALVGLILTISGTFLPASVTNPPWAWAQDGLVTQSLGVSYQVGAVLLIACIGGKNAATMSQVAYLLLGLLWFNIFSQGGGVGYVQRPEFGYLLGFVPAAWVCGALAFRVRLKLEALAFSGLCGLLMIHSVGLLYLAIAHALNWLHTPTPPLWSLIRTYSLGMLPGQMVILCAVTVVAYVMRYLMFY
ncbi:MAG: biotin transporter BioY [Kaiparowitsia implicata GSE-PSE-MK54-09C]|jgi:biotin transport system substrate-specific component|nr:biotin transporter BioY [Kaiparowitsia implicata GSE-PSE-MK54-09C]